MRLPNLLATRRGRLAAFFSLYVSEGIPFGFTATAIATQMRRQGLEPAVIGSFIAALYLPWAIKWAFGPVVDVVSSDRWGRRRTWILITQLVMVAALVAAAPVSFTGNLPLFTALIVVLNVASATQDVAIDALAVNTLEEHERGLANGLMFGGQYLGQAVGGAGVLFLTAVIGFQSAFYYVAAVVAAITMFVAVPMRERPGPARAAAAGSKVRAIGRELGTFVKHAAQAFTGSRAAFVGVGVALLPMGAYALSLALQSNLAVELGLDDTSIGKLNLMTTIVAGSFCVLGGWLSDRFGRRRTLALFIVGTTIPTLVLAFAMKQHGWVMPVNPTLPDRPIPSPELVRTFWFAVVGHAVFQGLLWGTGTAIFMDVTTPRVAATQFTAYMAMANFASSYTSNWQGHALQRWGYPMTLGLDCAFGVVTLILLWLMGVPRPGRAADEDEPAAVAAPGAGPGEGLTEAI